MAKPACKVVGIDHISIRVSNYEKSKAFYEAIGARNEPRFTDETLESSFATFDQWSRELGFTKETTAETRKRAPKTTATSGFNAPVTNTNTASYQILQTAAVVANGFGRSNMASVSGRPRTS